MGATPAGIQSKAKRHYAKPSMKRVQLRPEEAVLGACKNQGIFGPTAGNCKPLGNCQGMGS